MQHDHDWVATGRFKGGYITRHYGVDAVQLEIALDAYLDEATGVWDDARAARLQPLLATLLRAALG